jgi:hypothetical protein
MCNCVRNKYYNCVKYKYERGQTACFVLCLLNDLAGRDNKWGLPVKRPLPSNDEDRNTQMPYNAGGECPKRDLFAMLN